MVRPPIEKNFSKKSQGPHNRVLDLPLVGLRMRRSGGLFLEPTSYIMMTSQLKTDKSKKKCFVLALSDVAH